MTSDQEPNCGAENETSDGLKTYGAVLQALRDDANLTQEEFAPLVQYSVHYIAKIEQGKRFPPRDLPQRLEPVLGRLAAKVLKAAARSLNRKRGLAAWFQQWAALEEEALSLYAYECRAIPGLLQPESYVRALCERQLPPYSPQQIDERVAARLERQGVLAERPHCAFSFVIEESLLLRHLGGTGVTRQIIDHLLEVGRRNNVDIQVMPLRQEDHAGSDGQLYLAGVRENRWFGYTEGHRSSSLITEPGEVSTLLQRYSRLRSQALDSRATVSLLERMRGAL
ncbi:helix-turn-helix domain-containing protein [Streptomyces cacaoi]|uniref:Transcriptional regulator n=1 Tax=Streptomyces cacaoi TaxID=1898 RepID=A0A4Y3R7C3_STRCI|nr:helix-turn-helix transcriptional regulator [Streptomyces cacaoi]NNG85695.1 helix-turn-helix domain-containing protein [Streptomyces cacaoi]GEB53635.1 transcriptional regulator [Streptomyces cacaoi]